VRWVRYTVDIVGPAAAVNQNDPAKNLNDLRVDLDVADWAARTLIEATVGAGRSS
jgi:hypothetical protein